MERRRKIRAVWIRMGMTLLAAAAIVSLLVSAGPGRATLVAETYANVIRFSIQDAATVQVRVYDLAEEEVWDSGVVGGDSVDWDRTDVWGERLANGYYLYLADAWTADGSALLHRTGKVVLLPGDKVQLQDAPDKSASATEQATDSFLDSDLQTKGLGDTLVCSQLGVGTESPAAEIDVQDAAGSSLLRLDGHDTGLGAGDIRISNDGVPIGRILATKKYNYLGFIGQNQTGFRVYTSNASNASTERMRITAGTTATVSFLDSNVGVGTTNAPAKLTVQGASGSNLIAAYSGSARVFVVKGTGEVRADGVFYGESFNTGNADVAERINVSEWVEAGCVVEIDSEHPGFFRKSSEPYCRRVAGIVSTAPGVILGNSHEEMTDEWSDNRPMLAIAGRVPVKVSTENGPIQVGDLLVSSSTPGVAMRGSDPSACVGSVVGKAMEPLADGTGVIAAQVTLR